MCCYTGSKILIRQSKIHNNQKTPKKLYSFLSFGIFYVFFRICCFFSCSFLTKKQSKDINKEDKKAKKDYTYKEKSTPHGFIIKWNLSIIRTKNLKL